MKVGIVQLTSVLDFETNLKKIRSFLQEAKDRQVEAVFLPECFYSMSDGTGPTPYLVNGENEHYVNIQKLASDYSLYILAGTAAAIGGGNVVNRTYNFSPEGKDLGCYDKINLFSCNIQKDGKSKVIDEGKVYTPGEDYKIIDALGIKIGLGVCFDLRFPEMALSYREKGAQILTYSSAFTIPTGKAHWHTLVKARAIENQCYVIAPAQWGENNDKIQTYGHSLIVDPWGEVLADAKEGEKLIVADLNFDKIEEVRNSVIMKR
jgi:predicted amidohydrolase